VKKSVRKLTAKERASLGTGTGERLRKRLVLIDRESAHAAPLSQEEMDQENSADIDLPSLGSASEGGTPLSRMLDDPVDTDVPAAAAAAATATATVRSWHPPVVPAENQDQVEQQVDNEELEPPRKIKRTPTRRPSNVWHPRDGQVFPPGTYQQELYPENRVGSIWAFTDKNNMDEGVTGPQDHCALMAPPPPAPQHEQPQQRKPLIQSGMLQFSGPQVDYVEHDGEIFTRKDSSALYTDSNSALTWVTLAFAILMCVFFLWMYLYTAHHPPTEL